MTSVEKHLPGLHDQKDHGRRSLTRLAGLGSLARTISPKTNGQPFAIPTEPIDAGFRPIEDSDSHHFHYGDMDWETTHVSEFDEGWEGAYEDWATWPGNWAMRMTSASLMGQTLPAAIGDEYLDDDLRELLITGKVRHDPIGPDGEIIEVRDRSLLGTSVLALQDAHRYIEEAASGLLSVYWGFPANSNGGTTNSHPIFRGISVDKDDDILKLSPGDEFIMPLSAFTPNKRTADSFTDHGDDTTVGADVRAVLRLPAGTRAAPSPGGYNEEILVNGGWTSLPVEYVTAGKFVVDFIQWHSHDHVTIGLNQTAVFDPSVDAAHQWVDLDPPDWAVSKADLGIPEWVWKLSGSFASEKISKRRSYVPPHWRNGKPVGGYYREIGNKGAHKVLRWDVPLLTVGEARVRLGKALPNLRYQHGGWVIEGLDGHKVWRYEPAIEADIYGINRLTARERGTFVTTMEHMAEKYPETAKNIVKLNFYDSNEPLAFYDGIEMRAAAGSTSIAHHTGPPTAASSVKGKFQGMGGDYGLQISVDISQHAIAAAQFHAETFNRDKVEAKDIATLRWVDPDEDVNDTIQEWLAETVVHEFTHARHFSLIHDVIQDDRGKMYSEDADFWEILDNSHGILGNALAGTYHDKKGRLPLANAEGMYPPSLYGQTGGTAETLAEMGVAQEMGISDWVKSKPVSMLAKSDDIPLREGVCGWGIYDTMDDFLGIGGISKADLTPEFNGDVLDSLGEFADATRITGKLSQAQREAVRVQMRRAMARGEDLTKATSRIKRLHLGLSPRDSLALDNYREALRKQGFPEARVDRQVRAYSKRLQAKRDQLIASNEIAIAYGDAKRAEWTKAKDAGVLSDQAMRVYHTHPDERTCEVCRPLDGTKRKLDDPVAPPMHVNCRCWETIEDPGAKRGTLKQAKVSRPYRGNQHHRVTELVLTDKARALLRSLENDTEGITNWGAFAPPRSPIGKKKVVVPPYVKADGTKVDGYSYETSRRRRKRPVDRRVRDYTGKPEDWVQPDEFDWTRANIDLGTGPTLYPTDRAEVKIKVNRDLTKALMTKAETDPDLATALDTIASGSVLVESNDWEQKRWMVSKGIVRSVIDGWANSSWKTAPSTAFQKAVSRRFDAPGIKAVTEVRDGFSENVVGDAKNRKLGWNKADDDSVTLETLDYAGLYTNYTQKAPALTRALNVAMDAIVDSIYENTQKVLADQKVEELHLHRGTSAQYVEKPNINSTVTLEGQDYVEFVDAVESSVSAYTKAQQAYRAEQDKGVEIRAFMRWSPGDGPKIPEGLPASNVVSALDHEVIQLGGMTPATATDRRRITTGVLKTLITSYETAAVSGSSVATRSTPQKRTTQRLIYDPANGGDYSSLKYPNESIWDGGRRRTDFVNAMMTIDIIDNATNLAMRRNNSNYSSDQQVREALYTLITGREKPWEIPNSSGTFESFDDIANTIAYEYTQLPAVRDRLDSLWSDMHTTLVDTAGEDGMAALKKLRVMQIDRELLNTNFDQQDRASHDADVAAGGVIAMKVLDATGRTIDLEYAQSILQSIRDGGTSIPGGGTFAVDYLRQNGNSVEFTIPGSTSLGAVLQPASAFSTSESTAKRFGKLMLNAVVPKERILSTAMTGPGCLNEDEILVIGGDTDLSISTPSHGGDAVLAASLVVKADERIWPDLDEADWIKAVGDDITDY